MYSVLCMHSGTLPCPAVCRAVSHVTSVRACARVTLSSAASAARSVSMLATRSASSSGTSAENAVLAPTSRFARFMAAALAPLRGSLPPMGLRMAGSAPAAWWSSAGPLWMRDSTAVST